MSASGIVEVSNSASSKNIVFIFTSHHIQTTAVTPHFKHSLNHFPAVKSLNIPRQVVAASVPLADPHFESLMHYFTSTPIPAIIQARSISSLTQRRYVSGWNTSLLPVPLQNAFELVSGRVMVNCLPMVI